MNLLAISSIVILVALFFKVPVFVSLFTGSALYFLLDGGVNPMMFAQRAITGVESIPLLAIPFFVAAGVFMTYSGIAQRILTFCEIITGRMTGGLAQVNVLMSMVMGGLSGSNIADAAMSARMIVPIMEEKGYSKPFSTVLTAASSILTPLVPPGIAMIIYGTISGVSIGQIFMGGFALAFLRLAGLMGLVHIISKKRGYKPLRTERTTPTEFVSALKPALLALFLPVIIVGAIRFGVITATEAGAIATVYAIGLGLFYRNLNLADTIKGLKETVTTTSSIMLIIAAASTYSWVLTREQIPQAMANMMLTTIDSAAVFMIVVVVFVTIASLFVEGNALMLVLVPILAPIASSYGIDDVHFAMIYIATASIGALTPPVGTLMFVTCSITGCKTKDFIKEALPFYALLFGMLLFTIFVPQSVLWLRDLVY